MSHHVKPLNRYEIYVFHLEVYFQVNQSHFHKTGFASGPGNQEIAYSGQGFNLKR